MPTFAHALDICRRAHSGQLDKAGAPYSTHPQRVAAMVRIPDEKIVALLHDVVEKSPDWSLGRLEAEGFSGAVVTAVDALTHRRNEDYFDTVRRARADPLGRSVKLADLCDNIDRTRRAGMDLDAWARIARYKVAQRVLMTG